METSLSLATCHRDDSATYQHVYKNIANRKVTLLDDPQEQGCVAFWARRITKLRRPKQKALQATVNMLYISLYGKAL
jgi:hypothetical protein